jgi:hypothetical protein
MLFIRMSAGSIFKMQYIITASKTKDIVNAKITLALR